MKRILLGTYNVIRDVIGIVLCSVTVTIAGYIGLVALVTPVAIVEQFDVPLVNSLTVLSWIVGVFSIGFALFAAFTGIKAAVKGPMGWAGVAILIGLIAVEIFLIFSAAR